MEKLLFVLRSPTFREIYWRIWRGNSYVQSYVILAASFCELITFDFVPVSLYISQANQDRLGLSFEVDFSSEFLVHGLIRRRKS